MKQELGKSRVLLYKSLLFLISVKFDFRLDLVAISHQLYHCHQCILVSAL